MKASGNTPLINFLAANKQFIMAEIYTVTLLCGTVLRYTNGESDIVFGGNTYLSSGLLFKRSALHYAVGFEIAELEMEIIAEPTTTFTVYGQQLSLHQAAMRGEFDKAHVKVERLVMATYGDTTLGAVNQFEGDAGKASISRIGVRFVVRSGVAILDSKLPQHINQSACFHTLFDAGCQLVKSAFKTSKLVLAGSTQIVISSTTNFANAAPFYDLGTITFTSGLNNGISRTIKSQSSLTTVIVHLPFPYLPSAGDGFDVYPGCDKSQATCTTKFANLVNFSGKPYVPVPETAL